MSNFSLIAVIIFMVFLLLVFVNGKKPLTKSAQDFGIGNAIKSVALLSAAITIVVVLLLKYVVL